MLNLFFSSNDWGAAVQNADNNPLPQRTNKRCAKRFAPESQTN